MARGTGHRVTSQPGARTTGTVLNGLRAEGWTVYHDVRLPGRRGRHLDHVVIGPPGVFVIDVKHWAGSIEVRENSFWARGRRQDRVVAETSEASLSVAGLLGAPAAGAVHSALCFERPDPVAGWCYDVMLCSTGNLRDALVRRPELLSPSQIALATIELDLGFHVAANEKAAQLPGLQPVRRPRRPRRQPRPRRSEPWLFRWLRRSLFRLAVVIIAAAVVIDMVPKLADVRDDLVGWVKDSFTTETVVNELGYDSCDALRAIYPHGVGTPQAVRKLEGDWGIPAIKPEIYRASAKLDKDHDGLVCERNR